jgi:hypothetical protein
MEGRGSADRRRGTRSGREREQAEANGRKNEDTHGSSCLSAPEPSPLSLERGMPDQES